MLVNYQPAIVFFTIGEKRVSTYTEVCRRSRGKEYLFLGSGYIYAVRICIYAIQCLYNRHPVCTTYDIGLYQQSFIAAKAFIKEEIQNIPGCLFSTHVYSSNCLHRCAQMDAS